MRSFNTSGPCDPEQHYTVPRTVLLARGKEMVRKGKYFTLFAPRQAGKTTYFQLLFRELKREGGFTPIWISFENLKTVSREWFYRALARRIRQELALHGFAEELAFANQLEVQAFFEDWKGAPIVMVIDEFEGIPDEVLSEVMHTLREMYHQKHKHGLHALMLVGVSTVAELVVSSASPFNIVDQLSIPYFSSEEVRDLIGEHIAESGQRIEEEVIRAIYRDTNGQPGLVCALAQYLVEELVAEATQPITMLDYYKTLRHFLTERFDKNILNILQKAREKKDFMLRLLFSDQPIPFTVDDPNIAFLFANGVVENIDGMVEVPVPLYKKRLISSFRPIINGEGGHYTATHDDLSGYVSPAGLNLRAILRRYVQYVAKRGFHAFDTQNLRESAWHYSLDGFINFFIEQLGGQTLVEVPSGRGRTDIMILHQKRKYIIETKLFTSQGYFKKGKEQLAAYLASEGLEEGFYVVFSHKHTAKDKLFQEEMIANKRIVTYIVRVDFERASRGSKQRSKPLRASK